MLPWVIVRKIYFYIFSWQVLLSYFFLSCFFFFLSFFILSCFFLAWFICKWNQSRINSCYTLWKENYCRKNKCGTKKCELNPKKNLKMRKKRMQIWTWPLELLNKKNANFLLFYFWKCDNEIQITSFLKLFNF